MRDEHTEYSCAAAIRYRSFAGEVEDTNPLRDEGRTCSSSSTWTTDSIGLQEGFDREP
jgi:hypothetical protein